MNDNDDDCPNCGKSQIETRTETQTVQYKCTILNIDIPVRKCLDCNFEYTDHEAEDLIDTAIREWRFYHENK